MHIDLLSLSIGFFVGWIAALAMAAWFTIREDRAADDEDAG